MFANKPEGPAGPWVEAGGCAPHSLGLTKVSLSGVLSNSISVISRGCDPRLPNSRAGSNPVVPKLSPLPPKSKLPELTKWELGA